MSGSNRNRLMTIAEVCELLGISKTRFYALQKRGIFPEPIRTSSNRPVFDQTLVQQCQEVVRSRIGINGEPIVFNAKRVQEPSKKRPTSSGHGKHDDLILALGQLGLTVTKEQVATAVASLPNQGEGLDEASLVKAVFLHLKKTG